MLSTIFDKDGIPFEIREVHARRLLSLAAGWSREAPVINAATVEVSQIAEVAEDVPDHD